MATDRRRAARPHLVRAAITGLLALAGLVLSGSYGIVDLSDGIRDEEVLALIGVIVLVVAGVAATRAVVGASRAAAAEALGTARVGALAFVIQALGYFMLIALALGRLDIQIGGLLVGGAVTGVVLGIAAQQTLGNFFAGVILLLVQPFEIGERIVLRSGPLGGEYEGTVTDMSLFYVHLATDRGPVALPNAGVLGSAIGPGARAAQVESEEERPERQDPGPRHGGPPSA